MLRLPVAALWRALRSPRVHTIRVVRDNGLVPSDAIVDWPHLSRLRDMYAQEQSTRTLLDWLRSQPRHSMSHGVSEMEAALRDRGVTRVEIMRTLQTLDRMLSCGRLTDSGDGRGARMVWRYSPASVGAVAVGEADRLVPLVPAPSTSVPARMLTHTYLLRPDVAITLTLPADLTLRETQRLSRYLETLPFE